MCQTTVMMTQRSDINGLKECLDQSELRLKALELENKLMLVRMDNIADKLCFCTQAEATSQVDSFVILSVLRS